MSRTGQRYEQGGRLGWCPSSQVYRRHALRIVQALAARYANHPALSLWQVGNEFGGGNRHCYCAVSGRDFQAWLERRHGPRRG